MGPFKHKQKQSHEFWWSQLLPCGNSEAVHGRPGHNGPCPTEIGLRSAIAPPSSTGPAQSVLWWGKELQVREKFLSCIAFKPFWRNFRKRWDARHVNIYLDKKLILRLLKCNAQTLVILSSPIKQHVTLCAVDTRF